MNLSFKKSFLKELKRLPKPAQEQVLAALETLRQAKTLQDSGLDVDRMEGQKKTENYYRIRVGEWRLGVENLPPDLLVITVLHRSEIYKRFPPS